MSFLSSLRSNTMRVQTAQNRRNPMFHRNPIHHTWLSLLAAKNHKSTTRGYGTSILHDYSAKGKADFLHDVDNGDPASWSTKNQCTCRCLDVCENEMFAKG